MIDLKSHYLRKVKNILAEHVPEYDVLVFGSRAGKNIKKHSDLDLAIIARRPLSALRSAKLSITFAESDLPFKVDIIDWAETSEEFKQIIKKTAVIIQKSASKNSHNENFP